MGGLWAVSTHTLFAWVYSPIASWPEERVIRGTLADIVARLATLARARGVELVDFQSNAEHELVARVHAAKKDGIGAIVLNPGAFSHTSIALRDAVLGIGLPIYEVHLSNVYRRETFRHHSYFSDIAAGVVVGLGPLGYELALEAALRSLGR